MSTNRQPIAVVGSGAVGSILATYFAGGGEDVLLVESAPERREQLAKTGLKLTDRKGLDIAARPHALLGSLDELKAHRPGALFLCTKTWSLRTLLPKLAEALPQDTLIISFQNGIGPEDEIAAYFPPENVARGIVNFAGSVEPDGSIVQQWFTPPNYLGMLGDESSPKLEALAETLTRCRLATRAVASQETKKRAFFKTILNSALTALCASSGITMRQAMTYAHTRNLAHVLIREGLSVAAAIGYTYGENAKEVCMRYLDAGGDHLPSMWTDLQRKAPTEIEYINGKIVKIGLMFKNVDVDVNLFFTSMIITQEIKSGVRKPDEIPDYLTHF